MIKLKGCKANRDEDCIYIIYEDKTNRVDPVKIEAFYFECQKNEWRNLLEQIDKSNNMEIVDIIKGRSCSEIEYNYVLTF